jgi:uncharacterized protein (TIGR00251 family)
VNIEEVKKGVILTIFVKPNSSKFKVEISNKEIIVYVTSEPEKGKANIEILKEFTKLFHVKVELICGIASRKKKLFIAGIDKDMVNRVLGS